MTRRTRRPLALVPKTSKAKEIGGYVDPKAAVLVPPGSLGRPIAVGEDKELAKQRLQVPRFVSYAF